MKIEQELFHIVHSPSSPFSHPFNQICFLTLFDKRKYFSEKQQVDRLPLAHNPRYTPVLLTSTVTIVLPLVIKEGEHD
jgi:hypothetical protein